MQMNELITAAGFLLTVIATSWKLHSEISSIKLILERLVTKFEQVDRIEKRVDRLEKKVFHLDNPE